jgi:hypothetical protein
MEIESITWTGGCLCGAIRFEAEVAGTLDDPEVAPPQGHYGVENRVSWLKIDDDLKREPTQEDEYG